MPRFKLNRIDIYRTSGPAANDTVAINFRDGGTRGICSVTFNEGDMPATVAYRLCDLAKQVLALERSDTPPEPRMKDPPPPPPLTMEGDPLKTALKAIADYRSDTYVRRIEAASTMRGIALDALNQIRHNRTAPPPHVDTPSGKPASKWIWLTPAEQEAVKTFNQGRP